MKRIVLALAALAILPPFAEAQCAGGGRGFLGIRGRMQARQAARVGASSCGSSSSTMTYMETTTINAAGQTLGAVKTLVSRPAPQSEITLEGLAVLVARIQEQMADLNARMDALEKSRK